MVSAASLKDHGNELAEACRRDLGKSTFEAFVSEIDWCLNDIVFVCKNLARWAKDEKAADIPFTLSALKPKIRKDPLGCVLVIGLVESHVAYWFPLILMQCIQFPHPACLGPTRRGHRRGQYSNRKT